MLGEDPHQGPIDKEPKFREIVIGTQFSERARELLREPFEGKPLKAAFGVPRSDGTISLTEMWYELRDDDTVLLNTAKSRRKYDHLRKAKSVSLLVSRGNYQYVTMDGTFELIDDPETAQADIRRLAERYEGRKAAERMMREEVSRQERVSIILKPTRITEYFSQ